MLKGVGTHGQGTMRLGSRGPERPRCSTSASAQSGGNGRPGLVKGESARVKAQQESERRREGTDASYLFGGLRAVGRSMCGAGTCLLARRPTIAAALVAFLCRP